MLESLLLSIEFLKGKRWTLEINQALQNNLELLDTPGVLWPKFESQEVAMNLAFTGTIKDDILPKVEIAYQLLKYLIENYLSNVIERYQLNTEEVKEILKQDNEAYNPIYEIMHLIGQKRGCIVSGGVVDDEKVSNILLEDFRNCKLGKITLERVVD